MTGELDIQGHLVKTGNDLGGHFFKCNNRFMIGVPDLSCQLRPYPHVYVEVKYEKKFVRRNQVTMELTIHQERFITRECDAGGHAGWVMVVFLGNGSYVMTCGRGATQRTILSYQPDDAAWLLKKRGGEWPVKELLQRITSPKL